MPVDKNWPSWRYGPSGEAQIFQREADVPKGWVDSPGKLPPAPEKLGGEMEEPLRAENEKLFSELAAAVEERNTLRRAEEQWIALREQMRGELADLRKENTRLKEQVAIPHIGRPQESETPARRGARKLSASKSVPGTPFTPDDETVTLDEGRTERLRVLREAGVQIEDDATDGDIEEALDWLEQQAKKA